MDCTLKATLQAVRNPGSALLHTSPFALSRGPAGSASAETPPAAA